MTYEWPLFNVYQQIPYKIAQIFFILGAYWAHNYVDSTGRKYNFWAPMLFSGLHMLGMAFYSSWLDDSDNNGNDVMAIPTLVILLFLQSGNQFFMGRLYASALSQVHWFEFDTFYYSRFFFYVNAGFLAPYLLGVNYAEFRAADHYGMLGGAVILTSLFALLFIPSDSDEARQAPRPLISHRIEPTSKLGIYLGITFVVVHNHLFYMSDLSNNLEEAIGLTHGTADFDAYLLAPAYAACGTFGLYFVVQWIASSNTQILLGFFLQTLGLFLIGPSYCFSFVDTLEGSQNVVYAGLLIEGIGFATTLIPLVKELILAGQRDWDDYSNFAANLFVSRFMGMYGIAAMWASIIYLTFAAMTDNYSLSLDIVGLFTLSFAIYAAVAISRPDQESVAQVETLCQSCKCQTAPQNVTVQAEEVAEIGNKMEL